MRYIIGQGGIVLAGLASSVLTALLVAAVHMFTGFNLFTFSLWFVIPLGAIGCGFIAASGYYLAAKWTHQGARWPLLIQMAGIAVITQVLIYWLEYRMLVVGGVRASDVITFAAYLDLTITQARLTAQHMPGDSGPVGSFGYVLIAIEFIWFMIGGIGVYLRLKDQPACADCRKYFRKRANKKDSFAELDDLITYYNDEFVHPVDSAEFCTHVGTRRREKAGNAIFHLTTNVLECPGCQQQVIVESVHRYNGKELEQMPELSRAVPMPTGVDVISAYRGQ